MSADRFREATRQAARDLDASRAAVSVMKAGSRLAREIERALAEVDLTLPQFNVLMELAASPEGSLPLHAVIDRLISTPASVSWLTTRMGERGLVVKERDASDARVVVMSITEAGWSALAQAMPRVFSTEKDLWQVHGQAELRTIAALLEPLLAPSRQDR
jgi:DNA-binding MarR family transcriptional regulator